MPAMSEVRYARAALLHEAEIDEEIVALDRRRGEVFGFNKVASEVWRQLKEPREEGDLCRALVEQYDVSPEQCATEVRILLDELVELRLVKRIQAA